MTIDAELDYLALLEEIERQAPEEQAQMKAELDFLFSNYNK